MYKYYNSNKHGETVCVSFDAQDSPFHNIIVSNDLLPEEKVVHDELMSDILCFISKLPEQQRMAVTYRYVDDFSVAETAEIMGLPENTVKSNAHYGLQAIRKQMGINLKENKTKKGVGTMKKCIDIYGLFFEYAKGLHSEKVYLREEERDEINAHTAECNDCAGIVKGLAALWRHLKKDFYTSGYNSYYKIAFQLNNGVVEYTN